MTPEAWGRVKTILGETLELSAESRSAYLDEACAGDEELRREVESLLEAERAQWSFLDSPHEGWSSTLEAPLEDPPSPGRDGQLIGPYEILEEIGHGGMGEVYLARRADDAYQKKVAIKLVRPGMASREALARFRTERQISAALEHPNIARLLDGGTTDSGEPFFVMEYVEGESLLDACAGRGLSVEERLKLFETICGAVAYAHRSLVVHRDIKPSNILVTEQGEPKLLDFGIAKLLDPTGALTASDQTATILRVLTPDYASPEQVRGEPITTASDVYSLGVVLYELLAGRRPYHVQSSEVKELLRVVCEAEPERPSTAAARRPAETTAATGAAPDPDALAGLLKGDLDAIVMKAMRKEPQSRYGSVAELSEDLRRHREGRPVEARRGTVSYRAGKFARRHRLGLAVAAVIAVALAGGVFATLREARRARAAEARADRRFNDVRRLANSFLFEFHDAIRDLPGSTPARALLVRRALEYLDGLSRESAGDRELRGELAEAYLKVGDVQGNPFTANLGDMKGAMTSYGKAIALLELSVGSGRASDSERSALATAYLASGGLQLTLGNPEAAVALARKGVALRQQLAAGHTGDGRRQLDLAQAWQFLSFDMAAAGHDDEATEARSRQEAILLERQRADPADRAVRRSLEQNLYLKGAALHKAGDLMGALGSYREAGAILEALRREDPENVSYRRDLGYLRTEMGETLFAQGDYRAALEEFRGAQTLFQAVADQDPKSTDPILGIAMSHHNAGEALGKLGRPADAIREFRLALPLYEAILAASPSSAWVSGMLGALLTELAGLESNGSPRSASSCALYRRAVVHFEKIAAAGPLPPERRDSFDRAKAQAAACASAAR